MKFYVADKVFEKIPNAQFGLVSVAQINNSQEVRFVHSLLEDSIKSCEEHFAGKNIKEESELLPYRKAFTFMGINPNKFMSSIEALLTRIAKGKGMPFINPVVDLGNGISLKYYVPIGAHDLETMVDGEFCVRTAVETDTFLPFGAENIESVDFGEVVYATGSKIRTRRWIWRQSDEGKIMPSTKELLYIIDGFDENLDRVLAARDELEKILQEKFGCNTKTGLINKDAMEFETL